MRERKDAAIMGISASMENYLEAIFHIVEEKKAARPRDITQSLNVNASSVTSALRWLSEHGLINYAPFEVITLTPRGEKAARNVVRRHEALRHFFIEVLSINEPEADRAACEMEHAVSSEILDRLTRFAEFVEKCPRAGSDWIEKFRRACDEDPRPGECVICMENKQKEIGKDRA